MPPATATTIAAPMAKLLAERESSAAEEIHLPSAGKSIQGWLIRPPHFDAARKYPLLLDIADDPRRMYGPDLSLDAQVFAARGWVVLHVNPRGAPGTAKSLDACSPRAIRATMPTICWLPLTSSLVRAASTQADIAVRGGLVAAWLLGHSDRFAAVVARRPIVDFTLLAERAAPFLGALPWDDPDAYVKHSPIYFAQNWKTPTLVLAGNADAQSEEFYHALQVERSTPRWCGFPIGISPRRKSSNGDYVAWLKSVLP